MRVTCTNHCSGCDAHFASLAAFDLHRQGSFSDGSRHCVNPDDVKGATPGTTLVVKTDHGICRLKQGAPTDHATIYRTLASAELTGAEWEPSVSFT